MKAKYLIIAMTFFICTCIASPLLAKGGAGKGGNISPVLTEKEATDLVFLREEEKLARDVYLALFDAWKIQIFINISSSEQRHMNAVANLLDKYGQDDPVIDDTPGVFSNGDLEMLYGSLLEKGILSLQDALEVGVIIEEMDIHDIEVEMLPDVTKTDIKRVLTNLLAGSYNHLEAFENSLAALQ